MTRLMISVLDERRDPDFEAYARGYPTRALPGPSKEKDLEPYRDADGKGSDVLGPRNSEKERQNRDLFRPPVTDHGKMPNMKWSFADSHMRLEEGGWARETTVRELGTSKQLAGVNMRLEAGVYRELHWHSEAEWAYMLKGSCRITILDVEGGSYIDDLEEGDLWYFPTGFPHSIQGLGPDGCEFLLVFDDGNFSEDSTFLLTDYLSRTPKEVLAKNFRIDQRTFDTLSESEKYIFRGTMPGSLSDDRKKVIPSKTRFTHRMLQQKAMKFPGGTVRITDSTNFPVSKTVAAGHLSIDPGALREMHWHPNADEWSFVIRGKARVTIFASNGNARTFNYQAGDVGIVPMNNAHFIENIGDEQLEMLELFRADRFRDFSLEQWLAQLPGDIVADHMNLKGSRKDEFLNGLSKEKIAIKAPLKKSKSMPDISGKWNDISVVEV